MTDRFEPIENIDESFDIDKDDNNKSAMQNIVPFFKALDVMRKEGIINDENADFKRDVEFEKLITDQNFDPENLTEKELLTLNSYMNYIQSVILDNDNEFHTLWHSVKLNEDGTYNKIENYENVGTSSDNTHGNVHLEKGETKTITLYYLITDEEFENEILAIDFYIEGSPCKGTLAIIHEPEAN